MSSLINKITFCFLLIAFISACKEDNIDAGDNFTNIFLFSNSLFCKLVPIDFNSVDCYQQIVINDENQFCTQPWTFMDKYRMHATTCFRDRPHDAINLQCQGKVLNVSDNGLVKSFYDEWADGVGPRNQDVIWCFDRDGQSVYDTLEVSGGFGIIGFSRGGSNLLSLNLDSSFNITWQNTGPGNAVLILSVSYKPINGDFTKWKATKNHILIVPNSGNFQVTKPFLSNAFGLDFNYESMAFGVGLMKTNYKLKKYGISNEKTLLTLAIASTNATIECE